MTFLSKCFIWALFLLSLLPNLSSAWDSNDFELFDLVEEIQRNFYDVLGLEQSATSAEIRRAYRRLSLQLHPDKNKEEGAEEKFRQLVSVAEVLKDEEKRKRYDHVLEHGLPDWRQPVYYYRRVRKMGLLELSLLLTVILTVGHYLVIWSMYWERRFELESVFSKKRREKKSKKSNKQQGDNQTVDDPLSILDDPNILAKPQLSDIIPCQIFRLIKSIILGIPAAFIWVGTQIQSWKESRTKVEEVIEEEEDSEEDEYDDKERTKRRQRIDPALYEYDRTSTAPVTDVGSQILCDTNSAINNEQPKIPSGGEWTLEDTKKLIRAMAKYPGGTPARWEKIANEVGWPVDQVTKKAKSIKTSGYATHVDAAAQGITGAVKHTVMSKSGKVLGDETTNLPNNLSTRNSSNGFDDSNVSKHKHRSAKPAKTSDRTLMITEQAMQQNDDKSRAADEESNEKQYDGASNLIHPGVESCAWTQRQQKVLEKALSLYPKGTDGRWDRIADAVPGKSKEECLVRYKELVEVIKRKKQQATATGDQ